MLPQLFHSNASFEDFSINQSIENEYIISEEIYDFYIRAFADTNPLHINDKFAQKFGFKSKIMHGGILNGFVSHFVGVLLPGDRAILHSVHINFHSPLFFDIYS